MTKCIPRGNDYKLSYWNILYAASFNTSGWQRRLKYPLWSLWEDGCVLFRPDILFFWPSGSPAQFTASIGSPWERPFTINWRNQRDWDEQPPGKFSLIIYYIRHIIYCHRRKKTKQNRRTRIGSGPYKTAPNGDHITRTKKKVWSSVTQEVGSGGLH